MNIGKWLWRVILLVAFGVIAGGTVMGCQSLDSSSSGSDGHFGHSH